MSSLRVPVFFGSILTLVVLIIQNRAPVYQLTVLGMRFRPLGLGFLVAIAVLSGVVLGAMLQRMGPKRSPRASRQIGSEPEVQTFGSIPKDSVQAEDDDPFDFEEEEEPTSQDEPESNPPVSSNKGWDTSAPSSWTEEATQESFWSRRGNPRPKPERSGKASVTPLRPKAKRDNPEPNSVMDAEYRIVTPYERQTDDGDDGFDEDFFDDFFDEEEKP